MMAQDSAAATIPSSFCSKDHKSYQDQLVLVKLFYVIRCNFRHVKQDMKFNVKQTFDISSAAADAGFNQFSGFPSLYLSSLSIAAFSQHVFN